MECKGNATFWSFLAWVKIVTISGCPVLLGSTRYSQFTMRKRKRKEISIQYSVNQKLHKPCTMPSIISVFTMFSWTKDIINTGKKITKGRSFIRCAKFRNIGDNFSLLINTLCSVSIYHQFKRTYNGLQPSIAIWFAGGIENSLYLLFPF